MRPTRTRAGLLLLTMLVCRGGKPIGRELASGLLWPDSSREQALANLRLTLWDLRDALGRARAHLVTGPASVAIDLAGAFCDVAAFDEGVLPGGDAARAVEVWRGPLFEEGAGEWLAAERDVRTRRYAEVLERLASDAASAGDVRRAARYWAPLCRLEPLSEPAARGLMASLVACGRPGDAARVFHGLRQALREALGREPDAETFAVRDALRRGAACAGSPSLRPIRQSQPRRPVGTWAPVERGQTSPSLAAEPQPRAAVRNCGS